MSHHSPAGDDHVAASTRRTFLGAVSSTALAASLSGALGSLIAATPAEAVPALGTEALTGLLAYAVPGNDAYSRQQGVTRPTRGGASPGLTKALGRTLDEAIGVPIPGVDASLPGAVAISAWIDLTALQFLPAGRRYPFASPFCNLSWQRKSATIKQMETNPVFRNSPLCWVANELPLLAAFIAFSEAAERQGRTSKVIGRPVGWEITGWDGIKEGAPERRGYYRGRQAVDA